MSISAVVLTKNEEKNIERCLDSLSWCDEIVVIDDGSLDKTVALAKKYDAKVVEHALENNFSHQRNFGLGKAKNDWIFFVDADEVVSEELKKEINQYINNSQNKSVGAFITRKDILWGKNLEHGEQGNIKLLRLAKRNAGMWVGKVHETWTVSGPTKNLKNPLFHYPHSTISEFLEEINFYTSLRAEELFEQGKKVSWWEVIFYPKVKFIQNYFWRIGILDGTEGLVAALLMSFHSFLVRGKLWQLRDKK